MGITFYKYVGITISLVVIMAMARDKKSIKAVSNRYFIAAFILFVSGMIGALTFGHIDFHGSIKMAQNLVLLVIIIYAAKDELDFKALLWGVALGGLISVISSLWFERAMSMSRVAGIMGNANGFGQISVQTAIVITGLALMRKHFSKWVLLLLTVPCLIGLFDSASKGATISLVLAVLSFMLFKRTRKTAVVLSISTILLVSIAAPAIFFERWQHVFTPKRFGGQSAAEVRLNLAYQGMEVYKSHPAFGVGFGNSQSGMEDVDIYHPRPTHNVFAQALAEVGTVGTAAFGYLLAITLINLFKIVKRNRAWNQSQLIGATFMALFVAVFAGQLTSGNYIHSIWYLLLGAAYSFQKMGADNPNGRKYVRRNKRYMTMTAKDREIIGSE